MPVLDGTAATTEIRTRFPDTEVLVLTSVLEDQSVVSAMRAGATGYMLKNSDADYLARAIRAAAEGRVELPPEAAARLVREIKEPATEQLTAHLPGWPTVLLAFLLFRYSVFGLLLNALVDRQQSDASLRWSSWSSGPNYTSSSARSSGRGRGRSLGEARLNGIGTSSDHSRLWVTYVGRLPGHGDRTGGVIECRRSGGLSTGRAAWPAGRSESRAVFKKSDRAVPTRGVPVELGLV